MLDGPARRYKKRFIAPGDRSRDASALLLQRREERRHAVEILLTPLFVRMVMTPCAVQSDPQKNLTEHGRKVPGLTPVPVNHCRTRLVGVALGGQDFPGKMVEGFVLAEAVAQPLVEQINAFYPDPVRIRPDQIRPFRGLMFRPCRMVQETSDGPRPFVRIRIRQERRRFLRCREDAEGIQRGPAQEIAVRTRLGRYQPQLPELLQGQLIDKVIDRERLIALLRK